MNQAWLPDDADNNKYAQSPTTTTGLSQPHEFMVGNKPPNNNKRQRRRSERWRCCWRRSSSAPFLAPGILLGYRHGLPTPVEVYVTSIQRDTKCSSRMRPISPSPTLPLFVLLRLVISRTHWFIWELSVCLDSIQTPEIISSHSCAQPGSLFSWELGEENQW